MVLRRRSTTTEPPVTTEMLNSVQSIARPLHSPDDLDPLLERIGSASYVLLGEASHGTHEYYMWRAELSRRLIAEKGFSFIAVEGDWPDCYRVNRSDTARRSRWLRIDEESGIFRERHSQLSGGRE